MQTLEKNKESTPKETKSLPDYNEFAVRCPECWAEARLCLDKDKFVKTGYGEIVCKGHPILPVKLSELDKLIYLNKEET